MKKNQRPGQKGSAKQIINEIQKQAGNISCISSPSSLPRDRNQVYYQVRNVEGRIHSRSTGPTAAPNLTKLLLLQYSGSFLKYINFAVGSDKSGERRAAPNTFAATTTCTNWIKKFCKRQRTLAVARIDMTHKLGQFYLTTLTFANPMFVYKSNEQKHPTTLAAIMTSTLKEKNDYQYMVRCLKSEGVDSLVYGMDGECAMEMGFEDVFPIKEGQNVNLRCFDHVHSDMNHKLISIKVDDVQRKNILTDILGK